MNKFEKFGNIWLDPTRIVGVSFKYEEDYQEDGVSGVFKKMQTEKLDEVSIFLDTGAMIKFVDEPAEEVKLWWDFVTAEFGDVA